VDEGGLLYVAFKGAEAIHRISPMRSLHLKADFSQQGASSSSIQPQGADSSANPGELRRQPGGRDSPVVRNLSLPFIEVTSLAASGSDIPPQGDSGSSITVDWEPVVLAYHYGELVFP
jgi:hypothetical protein